MDAVYPVGQIPTMANGRAGVYVGTAEPLVLRAQVFNTEEGLAVVLGEPGGIIRTLRARLAANRRRFVVPVPALPLGNGVEAALVRFSLDIGRAGTARRPWIRTPRRCSAGGWATTYAPLFDTLGRVTLRDASPCRRP